MFTSNYGAGIYRLGNNLAGQYKRGVGMAIQIGVGNFSGAIAANIYRSRDSPRYKLGRTYYPPFRILVTLYIDSSCCSDGLELMFVAIGFVTTPIVILLYKRINKKREAEMREIEESGETLRDRYTVQQLRDLGDRAPDFRYTL